MFKGNLLKAAWNTVNDQEVKIIDSNAMLEKRIKEAGRFGCDEVFYQDEKNRLQGIEILKDYFQ